MTPHATRLPSTSDAKYHARRRSLLNARLGQACASCGHVPTLSQPLGYAQVDHISGGGTQARLTRGTAGEITYMLALSDADLLAYAQLLCVPCHKQAETTHLFRSTKAGA